jgi:hypothetical protein
MMQEKKMSSMHGLSLVAILGLVLVSSGAAAEESSAADWEPSSSSGPCYLNLTVDPNPQTLLISVRQNVSNVQNCISR